MLSDDTNSLRHLPRRSSENCDLQFANIDRRNENYSIGVSHNITSKHSSPRHKYWPAGQAHFSDRRASTQSFTGPYGPPRYISGQQISNSAGPNDDKSQYVLFTRAPAPHLDSFRTVLLLQRDASVARVGHVNQAH